MAKRAIKAKTHYNQAAFYAIAAGAVALGTYFLLSAVAADKVQANLVPTGRSKYFKIGEQVSFGLTNNGKTSVELPAKGTWRVLNEDDVPVVTSSDFSESTLPANESIYWSWDQTNRAGKQVEVGKYDIEITYLDDGDDHSQTIPINIVEGEVPWYKKFFN